MDEKSLGNGHNIGYQLVVVKSDDALIEVDWCNGICTMEPLQKLVHIYGFNHILGKWRKVKWESNGNIKGVELRHQPAFRRSCSNEAQPVVVVGSVSHPQSVSGKRRSTQAQVEKTLKRVKPLILIEFSKSGKIHDAIQSVLHRSEQSMQVYHMLMSKRSKNFDSGWRHQYQLIREQQPWKALEAA